MSKLKPTFLKEPFYQKKIKNYFDNENFDRSANLRNDANWYDKLDKKDIIYIPIWRSLNLFALKSDNLSEPVFLEFNDLKNFSPENYVKTFLGSDIINEKKKYFISIDFSILDEVPFNKDQIEKCSESIGIKFVLCLSIFFLIKLHPHIKDSLFAIAIVFEEGIIFNVGSRPSKPLIALIV